MTKVRVTGRLVTEHNGWTRDEDGHAVPARMAVVEVSPEALAALARLHTTLAENPGKQETP